MLRDRDRGSVEQHPCGLHPTMVAAGSARIFKTRWWPLGETGCRPDQRRSAMHYATMLGLLTADEPATSDEAGGA